MKILQLTAENVKRLSVVQITPAGHLVEITGANGQGKTSVLDSIWIALGGKDAAPDQPIRNGQKAARIDVKLGDADGPKLLVERTITEKGNYVTVRGAEGGKYDKPQKMLDDLMGAIGFDPLAFMRMKPGEQFDMLRRLVKLDVDLDALARKRASLFEERTQINRDLGSAKARSAAINVPDDLPEEEPDRSAIRTKLASAAEHNAAVQQELQKRERSRLGLTAAQHEVERIEQELSAAKEVVQRWLDSVTALDAEQVPEPIDAAALVAELTQADVIAEGFRKQAAKITAEAEVTTLERRAGEKTEAIEAIDKQKQDALTNAKMPIEGLSFADGVVSLNAVPLAQASAAEQLRVSVAIGAALNPKLRVILARDGSLLDSKSLAALAAFAEEHDMQVWLERVDETGAVGIVMEDGHVRGQEALVAEQEKKKGEEDQSAATGAPVVQIDDAATKRANDYLIGTLAMLKQCTTAEQCEQHNAAVKVKVKRFPQLIATIWNPEYLAHLKRVSGK